MEDEILQTKVISTSEVAKSWKSWLEAIDAEVQSLLEEKDALKKIARKELEEIQKKAAQEGRAVEIIPSKLVFTIKAGPNGGKRKTRWVICGNYESKKDSEQTFSSGADAAAFRLSIWAAARHQWAGAVIDIKTAFLNVDGSGRPRSCPDFGATCTFHREGLHGTGWFLRASKSCVWAPPFSKIVGYVPWWNYGKLSNRSRRFKRRKKKVPSTSSSIRTKPLESAGNFRWKPSPMGTGYDLRGWRLHLLIPLHPGGHQGEVSRNLEDINARVCLRASHSFSWDGSVKKKSWGWKKGGVVCDPEVIYQRLDREKWRKSERKKDPCYPWPSSHWSTSVYTYAGRSARSSKMCWRSTLASHPLTPWPHVWCESDGIKRPEESVKVMELGDQIKGYLKRTQDEGFRYQVDFKDEIVLQAYSDASFSPEGSESHGSFLVLLEGSPIFWQAGRQSLVTLSTAESEMTEVIEAMTAGELAGAGGRGTSSFVPHLPGRASAVAIGWSNMLLASQWSPTWGRKPWAPQNWKSWKISWAWEVWKK